MTERAFQAQVERYARLHNWLTYHTWNSMRSAPGFPDLVLIRQDHGGGARLVVAELKTLTGKTTAAQERWLDSFRGVPGVSVHLWRPTDEDWAEIEAVLGRAA